MKTKDPILAAIQREHGCNACQHRQYDDWLGQHTRHWCAKHKRSIEAKQAVAESAACVEWRLVSDKEQREALIKDAEDRSQPRLPSSED